MGGGKERQRLKKVKVGWLVGLGFYSISIFVVKNTGENLILLRINSKN